MWSCNIQRVIYWVCKFVSLTCPLFWTCVAVLFKCVIQTVFQTTIVMMVKWRPVIWYLSLTFLNHHVSESCCRETFVFWRKPGLEWCSSNHIYEAVPFFVPGTPRHSQPKYVAINLCVGKWHMNNDIKNCNQHPRKLKENRSCDIRSVKGNKNWAFFLLQHTQSTCPSLDFILQWN